MPNPVDLIHEAVRVLTENSFGLIKFGDKFYQVGQMAVFSPIGGDEYKPLIVFVVGKQAPNPTIDTQAIDQPN